MVQNEQQAGMFDVVLDDPELEEQLGILIEMKESVKNHTKARRRIKDLLEGREFKPGDRVRVGRHSFEIKAYSGGGFEIKHWQTQGIQKIMEL